MLLTLLLAAAAVQGDCANAATQMEMNRCATAAWQQADAAMTTQWRATYAAAKTGGAPVAAATLESQRAWLKFRDAQCAAEAAGYAGGSIQPLTRANCLARLTRGRMQQLRAMRRTN